MPSLTSNSMAFLNVPGRWQTLTPENTTFNVFLLFAQGKWSFHCREVDLLGAMKTLRMVDRTVRLGLCALYQMPDATSPALQVNYHRL
jgi:hypothetical protein